MGTLLGGRAPKHPCHPGNVAGPAVPGPVTHLPPVLCQGQPHAEPAHGPVPRPGLPRGHQLPGQVSSVGLSPRVPTPSVLWLSLNPCPPLSAASIPWMRTKWIRPRTTTPRPRYPAGSPVSPPPIPIPSAVCWSPRVPFSPLPWQLWGGLGVSVLVSSPSLSPAPDRSPLPQPHKSHPMDPTEDKVLVAALDAKEPTKMAYINNTFSTTDL